MADLSLSAVAIVYGATTLLDGVTLTVETGDRWGIVGRNGSGKTSLFRLLTGELEPSRGTIARASNMRVSVLDQHRDFGDAQTVWEAAAGPWAELFALERSLAEQANAMGADVTEQQLARYSRDLERFEREGGYTIAPRIDAVLHGLHFDPEESRTKPVSALSGGERGRLGLVRQLVAPADLLLLDEPTNHLDVETTEWLEEYLTGQPTTQLVISHDRDFLDRVANHVLHLENTSAVAYEGNYSGFVRQRAERRMAAQRQYENQSKVIAKEEDFIRRNIAGQNSKQAVGRKRRLDRLPRLSAPPGEDDSMAVRFDVTDAGGKQVLVFDDVSVVIGERRLIDRFSAVVQRGEVIGLVGPNGAGKSSLLRVLVGERQPASGAIKPGAGLKVGYYSQDLSLVPKGKTIYNVIADLRNHWGRGPVQSHLGRFGFSGDTVQRMTDTLSGGELARVALAMLMLSGANLLIFDEPTNHLDVESIEALEDAIESYDGTVILVSHDRALLRALVTRVWVLHERHITDYPGTYSEWEAASRDRAHAARVAAAEDEATRRVRERQRTQAPRKAGNDRKGPTHAERAARRALEAAEEDVASRESRVAALVAQLEDPALYVAPDGAGQAHRISADLDAARRELDQALARWEAAAAAMEPPK